MASTHLEFLQQWNQSDSIAKLLDQLALYQFVQLNGLQTLQLTASPRLILYKYQNPITGDTITLGESQSLSVGKMHSLQSLARGFGYLFEFPNVKFQHGPGYFGVNRKANPEQVPAEVRLKGTYLNIFESEAGVLCIGRIPPNLVDRYGFKDYDKKVN